MNKNKIETTNWLTEGISNTQLKTEKALAVISAQIFTKRTKMGMDQKSFAKFMGVSQGMISKWESGTYNFTISTLIGICEKLDLLFEPQIFEKEFSDQNTIFVVSNIINYDKKTWGEWTPRNKDRIGKVVA